MGNNFALITGASQGLGFYLSSELAKRGYNLLIVSLPNENIKNTSENLEKEFNIIVKYKELNLTMKSDIIELCDWANLYPISILINNAGCGGSKKIEDASLTYIETIIQLNITATTTITKLLLPNLIKNAKSHILNIASMAAFSPIGYKTVYPASKKFIDFFSLGLHEELKDKNVSVTVAYPGPMKTNKEVTTRIESQNKFVNLGVVELNTIAKMCIDAMLKGKRRIIPGKLNLLSKFILSALPLRTKVRILSTTIKKEIN